MNITYHSGGLTPGEYDALRLSVGWAAEHPEQSAATLEGSDVIIVARDVGEAVGMARIFSDGGANAYIEDVIVRPDHQKQGIARELVTRVLAHMRSTVKPGYRLKITNMSAEGLEGFYGSFGWESRPSPGHGHGMAMWYYGEGVKPRSNG
ncbi:MAG: GNAT family N-acetyltransferase [Oscillospiraceae bacterium]|nr:GNAT family N-acetyltransferase [Oscillospiraceae bacterium]